MHAGNNWRRQMKIVDRKVQIFPLNKPMELSYDHDVFPTKITVWSGGYMQLEEEASHYIVVYSGRAVVGHGDDVRMLGEGHYGVFPGKTELVAGGGAALIVSSMGYNAMPLFGGPIEDTGRLRYIDNCKNTVLLPPPVKGEPCLNFLDLCPGVTQTPHTHPSIRIGMILRGNGACGTANGTLPLSTGTLFVIPPETLHSFESREEPLKIVIYHPDSVDGPTHTSNTMLNNTFVDGKTAQEMPQLHTKEELPA
jgi:mannose-6-phosphate isomerase-like protein (cupin superfamily)